MTRRGFRTVIVYLIYFLIMGDSESKCKSFSNELIRLLSELRFQINWEDKAVPSTQEGDIGDLRCCSFFYAVLR